MLLEVQKEQAAIIEARNDFLKLKIKQQFDKFIKNRIDVSKDIIDIINKNFGN